jgi:hypothetical protein
MDDFESVLRKGLAGVTKGAPLLVAGLIAGVAYATALFNTIDINTADALAVVISALISFIPLVVVPYVTGGAYGYALEAAAGGKPGWPTFFASAKKHYLSLFFAGLAIVVISSLLSYPAALFLAVGGGGLSFLCLIEILTLIVMFIVLMFLEFYDVAIVSENLGAMDGLRASFAFVRKNSGRVFLFFLIVLVAKLFVQLPYFAAELLRTMAEIGSNASLMFNNTTTGELNSSYFNSTLAAQAVPMSIPTLLSIAVLQILVQMIVFAFVVSFKTEFYKWAKNFKSITDFDYDFSEEKKV